MEDLAIQQQQQQQQQGQLKTENENPQMALTSHQIIIYTLI